MIFPYNIYTHVYKYTYILYISITHAKIIDVADMEHWKFVSSHLSPFAIGSLIPLK